MADATRKLMTVEEFLAWDDGTDTSYELLHGVPMPRHGSQLPESAPQAMAPAKRAHNRMQARLAARITTALGEDGPCAVETEVGIAITTPRRTMPVADLAVSCSEARRDEVGTSDPILIVEVLSPSTEERDRKVKLALYRLLPSVREILLIDPSRLYCEVHRRVGDIWATDLLTAPDHVLRLDSAGLSLPLEELYTGQPLDDELTTG
jgi:Uma2 family endonuclease